MRRREARDDEDGDGSDKRGKPAWRDPMASRTVYEDDEEFGAEEYKKDFEAEGEVELEETCGEEGGHHGSVGEEG